MNLIEQLGGYKATKEKYQALSDSDMITIGPVEFSAKDYFEDELLEYRRQHNIFEVGDKVVYRTLPHERLFSVRYVGDDEIVVYELWDEMGAKTFTENYPYSDIDHANDAEIEAGKRLEVNHG